VIPNLGVWIPPDADYNNGNTSEKERKQTDGAGSDGLVLCVSNSDTINSCMYSMCLVSLTTARVVVFIFGTQDVPGLIAGAAQGVGLGHAFLRHVERCHMILHLVDATSNDPVADFEMLNRELVNYGTGQLARMPQVVVINKIDALQGRGEDWESGLKTKITQEELEEKLQKAMSHSRLMWMSAKERDGVDDLMIRMAAFVKKVKGATEA
jgi:GTPase involved in cell partitioning and DNA repair